MTKDVLFGIDQTEEGNEEAQPETQLEKYLQFLSDGLLFGVSYKYVVEIITNHAVTHLPLVPEYVHGIINLRGQIIPIVDIRILLGHPKQENRCIIILNIDGTLVGVLVDSVIKMLDVDTDSIHPAPPQNHRNFVTGMYSLSDGQTMLIFNCLQILNED